MVKPRIMASGTHVGIIGSVANPGKTLKGEMRRALDMIVAADPPHPLVLHYADRSPWSSTMVAREHAASMGSWQVEPQSEPSVDVADACHILIVVAKDLIIGPGLEPPKVWRLAEWAEASGRTVVHIRVPRSQKRRNGTRRSGKFDLREARLAALRERNAESLRKLNPTDPDVWR